MSKRAKPRFFSVHEFLARPTRENFIRWYESPPPNPPPLTMEKQARLRAMLDHAMLLEDVRSHLKLGNPNTPSRNVRDYLRWRAVVEARQEGRSRRPRKATWLDAYKEASQRLADRSNTAGSPRTMKRSYMKIERLRRTAKVGPSSPT
jgi:hypothetical protein